MNDGEFKKYSLNEDFHLVNREPLTVNFMRENRFPYSGSNFALGMCYISQIICAGSINHEDFESMCNYYKIDKEHLLFLTLYHSLTMSSGVLFARAVFAYPRERPNNRLTEVDFKLILDTLARSTSG